MVVERIVVVEIIDREDDDDNWVLFLNLSPKKKLISLLRLSKLLCIAYE